VSIPTRSGEPDPIYGTPIEISLLEDFKVDMSWDQVFHLPKGYRVLELPDAKKALECHQRPEAMKGDLGHAFPPLDGHALELVEDQHGHRYLARGACGHCGLRYGRSVTS